MIDLVDLVEGRTLWSFILLAGGAVAEAWGETTTGVSWWKPQPRGGLRHCSVLGLKTNKSPSQDNSSLDDGRDATAEAQTGRYL